MNIYSIYKVTNKTTDKIYIGWTSRDLFLRQKEHIRESFNKNCPSYKTKFHKAIKKYGVNDFDWIILYQSKDKEHSHNMEKYFINLHKSNHRNIGYNITSGGEGFCGTRSEENKRKSSESAKKRPLVTEETKKKLSEINKARWQNKEYKDKMSLKRKGENNPMFGKTHSLEVKEKLRIFAVNQKRDNNGKYC
jgi:hypothetical protein